jgi:tetratricopeptide (TPR) repeat protein
LHLGERESGTAKLEQAVAAFREALKEGTRERAPLDWASTQNNLGYTFMRLGERDSGTAKLEEAVTAYREALKERTRERVPLAWAGTQNNLGIVLVDLAGRETGREREGRQSSKRPLPPIARRSRNGRASACGSSGPRPRAICALR